MPPEIWGLSTCQERRGVGAGAVGKGSEAPALHVVERVLGVAGEAYEKYRGPNNILELLGIILAEDDAPCRVVVDLQFCRPGLRGLFRGKY